MFMSQCSEILYSLQNILRGRLILKLNSLDVSEFDKIKCNTYTYLLLREI